MSELEKEVESVVPKKRSPRGKSGPAAGGTQAANRRAAATKPAAGKKKAPARRATAKRKPAARAKTVTAPGSISADERIRMISDTAYYRAERRGFRGGHSKRDWLEAEAEVDALLLQERSKDE